MPAPTPPPSNVIAEGDPHVSSLTDDSPGVMRWCTRPSTGLPRTARAFNKVARLRQAAQMWQPDFDEYVGRIMDSLTREEFDAFIEEALRYFTHRATHQWLQIKHGATRLRVPLTTIPEVRETSCWALDLECEADKKVAHELLFQCDLQQVASLSARDLFPRGHRLALDSVSFIVDTIRA